MRRYFEISQYHVNMHQDLLMAVACITHTVHRHSAIGRVMTAGNSCQLVRLLLGKAIYPNEVIPVTERLPFD